jgi:hypothetical protein
MGQYFTWTMVRRDSTFAPTGHAHPGFNLKVSLIATLFIGGMVMDTKDEISRLLSM